VSNVVVKILQGDQRTVALSSPIVAILALKSRTNFAKDLIRDLSATVQELREMNCMLNVKSRNDQVVIVTAPQDEILRLSVIA
jgi:hypothetical protein